MLHHALLEGAEAGEANGHEELAPGFQRKVRRLSHTFRTRSVDHSAPAATVESTSILREIPALSVAMLMSAINAVSYGTLLFASPATSHAPNGTVIWLMSTIGTQIGTLLVSNIQNGISCPMLEMIPIMHALFLNIASKMHDRSPEELQATCLASCFVCTFGLGVGLLIGTRLGLASYLRAVPLIVLKGALFGVALFLMSSCLKVSSGDMDVEQTHLWAPAVLLGLALFAVDEAIHSPVAIALSLLAVGLIPSCLDLLNIISLNELQEKGWCFQPGSIATEAWYMEVAKAYKSAFLHIDWMVIIEIMPAMVGIAASASLLMLMDLKAVELLTEREFSLDKELRSIGVSNLLSALCGGGFPCYILCSLNVTCHRLGGRSALIGVGLTLSSTCCLFVVSNVVPHLPRALPGGLFMWLSLVFAKETIVDICSKYTHISDVFIVAIMALVVKFYSFNDGLFVGTLLAMSVFTVRYSGSQAGVRTSGDARFYRSICTRDGFEHEALEQLGHLIAVVHVEGFLMFGSTPAFTDAVRQLMVEGGPEWILLNFQAVQGLDYSAALELATLGRKAKECGRRLVLTELNGDVQDVLLKARVEMQALPRPVPGRSVRMVVVPVWWSGGAWEGIVKAHYQRALQRCEDGVLSRIGLRMPSKSQSTSLGSEDAFMREVLKRYFGDFLPENTSLETTLSIFSKQTVEPGSVLWRAGEPCSYCVCVTEGTLHAMQPSRTAGKADRLACIAGPGDFSGFLAMLNHFPYEHTVLVPEEAEDDTEAEVDDEGACQMLVLQKNKYQALLLSDPPFAQALLRGFLRQISYECRELSRLANE
ncbi:Uncharacterized vacuolar membrane protein YGR125W [Durusdinium trenchii]|uniref:Uncharacterized vacuolar membrane protein YGR125W n=1 Tax=Durusdinium trenchii TaxID=1381693 RepID=A0ABP0SG14_9DINO